MKHVVQPVWRAGITLCSLDTINPGVQVSNQISLWQALGDYPWVLWVLTAGPAAPWQTAQPGNRGACFSLQPASAWPGPREPLRLMDRRPAGRLTVRARPSEGCMARMGRCTSLMQVKVTEWVCGLLRRGGRTASRRVEAERRDSDSFVSAAAGVCQRKHVELFVEGTAVNVAVHRLKTGNTTRRAVRQIAYF